MNIKKITPHYVKRQRSVSCFVYVLPQLTPHTPLPNTCKAEVKDTHKITQFCK